MRYRILFYIGLLLLSGWLLMGCRPPELVATPVVASEGSAQSSTTATPEPTETPLPSATPTATNSPTPTEVPPPTATPLPQPTPDGQIRSVRVPILMYHYISELPPDADKWRVDLTVSPENFESHLRWLSENGYQSITLADLLMALQTGAPLPEKPIIITLDDGYRDAYVHAFPLLKQYNMRATVFVITSLLDENNVDFLSWDMATEMSAAGIDIESHTVYHPDLRDSDYERLRHELVESRLAIEAHTHIPSRFLCYPSGLYNPDVMQAVRESGYWAGITTMQGTLHTNANLWEIKRVRVRDNATTEQLLALIAYLDAM